MMNISKPIHQQDNRLQILNFLLEDNRIETGREIIAGLTRRQKRLPSKYFYDAYGSRLFERICDLPEYYLTRTELAILQENSSEIMAFFNGPFGDLVELGSGSNRKIKFSWMRWAVQVCAGSAMSRWTLAKVLSTRPPRNSCTSTTI